jgi:FtsP/CotA-like multicopper oxidase with cupredoxin domain
MDVTNNLNESTTLHWHDAFTRHYGWRTSSNPGGNTLANRIDNPNQAATLWYHPSYNETTQEQLTKGVGGFIIKKTQPLAALAISRTYGG